MTQAKISLFGNFGTKNLGNECTLQAMIDNLREYAPDASIECICTDPDDAAARYGISTRPMSYRNARWLKPSVWPGYHNALIRLLRRIFVRIPRELIEWIRAFRTLKGSTMLVMPGTGMLGDFGADLFGMHYELAKWSLIAKLRGCRVLFVSVGGGRLRHPLSRWFITSALSLANYRSYRDAFSKEYLESIGFNTRGDRVYPDLAFSLRPAIAEDDHNGRGRVVGIGVMEYLERGERLYHAYLEKVTAFATWLLERNYTVRLVMGDVVYDKRVRQDVIERVNKRTVYRDGQLISESLVSVEQLVSQLATTDMVVATRFHNVLVALMLNKPVISISYDEKNDSLMAEAGLAEYCHDIERIDVDTLVKQFSELQENAAIIKQDLKQKVDGFRAALDAQYASIFASTSGM